MNALSNGYRLLALIVVASITAAAIPTMAATRQLLSAGQAGGWTATAPDWANVDLQVLGVVDGVLYLKKHVVFEANSFNPDNPGFSIETPIHFVKQQNAVNRIAIDFEEMGNETGHDFFSFDMNLVGVAAFHDPSAGFKDPGLSTSLTGNGATLLMNGTIPQGQSFFPGFGPGNGDAIINAFGDFTLNEGFGKVLPLPSAAWMGLAGLLALCGIKQAKQLFGYSN